MPEADRPKADGASTPARTIPTQPWAVRVAHAVNALCVLVLMMSGAQILNAHPRLYWGQAGAHGDSAWLEWAARPAIPHLFTLPGYQDLAAGRDWHFAFAWLFVANMALYAVYAWRTRRLAERLLPTKAEWRLTRLAAELRDHMLWRFPRGAAAAHYNTLQKIAYLSVLLLALPLMIVTGLAMSPGMNAVLPWLTDILGGRQSARSLHFLSAAFIGGFVLIHLTLVFFVDPVNQMRSILLGRRRIEGAGP